MNKNSVLYKVSRAVDNCDSFCDRVEMAAVIHHVPYDRDLAIRVAYEVAPNLHVDEHGVVDHEKVEDDAIIKAISERNKNLHGEVHDAKPSQMGK